MLVLLGRVSCTGYKYIALFAKLEFRGYLRPMCLLFVETTNNKQEEYHRQIIIPCIILDVALLKVSFNSHYCVAIIDLGTNRSVPIN
jgi:hypothetical protein